jgi:hypothetical protein
LKTQESRLIGRCVECMKAMRRAGHDIWWVKIAGGSMQRAGLPDMLILFGGCYLWVEFKTDSGRLTPLQGATLSRIKEAGGLCRVVRSSEKFRRILTALTRLRYRKPP